MDRSMRGIVKESIRALEAEIDRDEAGSQTWLNKKACLYALQNRRRWGVGQELSAEVVEGIIPWRNVMNVLLNADFTSEQFFNECFQGRS